MSPIIDDMPRGGYSDREWLQRGILDILEAKREREKRPHTCPVCNGAGLLNRPPWVPGDQPTWASSDTTPHECRACSGAGVLWR